MRIAPLLLVASALVPSLSRAQNVPIIVISPENSSVRFFVKASVALAGKFDKWDATLVYPSTDVTAGVLAVKIHADSVDTGSGMKNGKLRSKDFFDAKENPLITFVSDKISQTGPTTFIVHGVFSIRGVSKPETLVFVLTSRQTDIAEITGTMAFDRKEFGMDSSIPFIRIADRVEVTLALKAKRVSGPPLVYKE